MSVNIATKIWLSTCIIILGYFISVMVGISLGLKTENKLSHTSDVLFPATRLIEKAVSAFDKEVKLYFL